MDVPLGSFMFCKHQAPSPLEHFTQFKFQQLVGISIVGLDFDGWYSVFSLVSRTISALLYNISDLNWVQN